MKLTNRNLLILGGVGLVIVIAAIFLFVKSQGSKESKLIPTPSPEIVELLPADALAVSITKGKSPLYVLTISKIPEGTVAISYEITYDTKNKGTQGIVGSPVQLKVGQTTYTNEKIVFGSESRGKYSLDEGVSNIQINIRITLKDGTEKGWKGTLEI